MYTRSGNLDINALGQWSSICTDRSADRTFYSNTPGCNQHRHQCERGSTSSTTWARKLEPGRGDSNRSFINPDGALEGKVKTCTRHRCFWSSSRAHPAGRLRGHSTSSLEAANVEPVKELIDLITTQRGFELNSQAIQAGDQILQQIAN